MINISDRSVEMIEKWCSKLLNSPPGWKKSGKDSGESQKTTYGEQEFMWRPVDWVGRVRRDDQ